MPAAGPHVPPSPSPPSPLPSPPSLRPRCSSSLPPTSTPGPLPAWSWIAVPSVFGSPSARPPGQPLRAPPQWSCPSRTPPHRAWLSVRRVCAVARCVRAIFRASGLELMASWGPRSARPLPRLSPPSPRPCTTSPGSAGRAPQGGRVWVERSTLGCWTRASWGPRHGIRIREAELGGVSGRACLGDGGQGR